MGKKETKEESKTEEVKYSFGEKTVGLDLVSDETKKEVIESKKAFSVLFDEMNKVRLESNFLVKKEHANEAIRLLKKAEESCTVAFNTKD